MDIVIEATVPLSEYIEKSNNGMKELNSIIELCEMRILYLRGEADGVAAASWIIDGNTTDPIAVLGKLIRGIADGDPEILDSLPAPDLSGQWADKPTLHQILKQEFTFYPEDPGVVGAWEEYGDAYDNGFNDGVHKEILRMYNAYRA